MWEAARMSDLTQLSDLFVQKFVRCLVSVLTPYCETSLAQRDYALRDQCGAKHVSLAQET